MMPDVTGSGDGAEAPPSHELSEIKYIIIKKHDERNNKDHGGRLACMLGVFAGASTS